MKIARRFHTAGNSIRYEVDYCQWLDEGRTLKTSSFTASLVPDDQGVAPPSDVTVNNVSVTPTHLYFFVNGGSVNETFTVQVEVVDTLNETVIDTIDFTVVAP